MRRLSPLVAFTFCLCAPTALLAAGATRAAQTPTPVPSPVPTPLPPAPPASPTPPAEVPDKMTDLQRAARLTDKPIYRPSDMKPGSPLYSPEKEVLFTSATGYRKPSRFKIGGFFPDGKSLREHTESVLIALGASLDLPAHGKTRALTPELFIDSAFSTGKNNRASLVGVGAGVRLYPGAKNGFAVTRLNHPVLYVGAGLGEYFLHYRLDGASASGSKFGGKATIGLDFTDAWGFEANYSFIGKVGDVNFSGPAILAAYRF